MSATIDAYICAMHSMHVSVYHVSCRPRKDPTWTQRDAADRKRMWEEWQAKVSCLANIAASMTISATNEHATDQGTLQVRNLPEFKLACKDRNKKATKWTDSVRTNVDVTVL